jgi:hypothetical protein
MKRVLFLAVLPSVMLLLAQGLAQACSSRVPTPEELVEQADVIVRATADSYDKAPEDNRWTTGLPKSTVKFKVIETLKGELTEPLLIYGYLTDKDDYNDHPVPFTFIRRGGRHGSCIANSYKEGADFLLFLKKRDDKLTPYWSGLTPVNEQLRTSNDEWLRWVKEQLQSTPMKKEQPKLNAFLFSGYNTFFEFVD